MKYFGSPEAPTLADVDTFQTWIEDHPLRLFKNGAKTGETAGWLIEVEERRYRRSG